jgi:predicted ribosome quality control (RQC) complex YloA/Tae2 family protein
MKKEIIYFDDIDREITYLVGKNKQDNFHIIDISSPDDIWFHANNVSSCHVILQLPEDISDKKILKILIKKGALLCKQNTHKLNNEKNVEIIYTFLKNVTKTKVCGCVTTKNTKSLYVN